MLRLHMLRRLFWPRPRHLIALVVGFSAVLLVVYYMAINSEAYSFADEFVARDERVAKLTGRQSERSLLWRKGFDLSYGHSSGEAALTLNVAGERGDFNVPMKLVKKDGRWSVVDATIVTQKGEEVAIVAAPKTK